MVCKNIETTESYCYGIIKECWKMLKSSLQLNTENTELFCHVVLCKFTEQFLFKYSKGVPKDEPPIETRDNMEKLFQKAIDLTIRNLENEVCFQCFCMAGTHH